MDNLTHTLAGAALGAAGLSGRTRLATPALLIGANLPDIDALVYLHDSTLALAVRRGWTHGVLALVVLPLVLAGALALYDRLRRHGDSARALEPGALLLVCAIGVWSHPLLDWLNTYGVRLLMPFSRRWFYGDTLFIVDPWLLLILGGGVLVARRRGVRAARVALVLAVGYIGGSWLVSRAAVAQVRSALADATPAARQIIPTPVPANPFVREVIVERATHYEIGHISLVPPARRLAAERIERNLELLEAARGQPLLERYLVWARVPFVVPAPDALYVGDARYTGPRTEWAGVLVPRSR